MPTQCPDLKGELVGTVFVGLDLAALGEGWRVSRIGALERVVTFSCLRAGHEEDCGMGSGVCFSHFQTMMAQQHSIGRGTLRYHE